MPAGRSTYIRLPCFLLLAILAAPFVLIALLEAAVVYHTGSPSASDLHGNGIRLVLALAGSLGASVIFAAYVLISTWPEAESDPGLEDRKNFLQTRKGILGLCVYLIAQLLIAGAILLAIS